MRAFTLLMLFAGSFALMGCPPTDEPTDPPDGDADTDADTDTDTDTDSDTDTDISDVGGDCASAYEIEFDVDGNAGVAEKIGEPGDRDFFFVNPDAGTTVWSYVASYYYDEDGEPDTVMRLYDADCNFLGENDDHPYWSWGTDSAMFFQAYDAAGYYIEVLEWGDWADDYDGSGGSSWDYEVYFSQLDLVEYEWADNEGATEAAASYDEAAETTEDDLWYYWYLFGEPVGDNPYVLQMFGEIEAAGDEDWYVYEIGDKSVGSYLRAHLWGEYTGMLDAVVSVYSPMGDMLCESVAPGVVNGASAFWGEGGGCTLRAEEAGYYYVKVEDGSGNGGEGAGFFYPLIFSGPWSFTSGDLWEIESNHPTGLANTVAMSESTNTPGYFYGSFPGALDSPDDESDNFKVLADDTNGLDGKYLSVYIETSMQGSMLDAKVTVYEDTGGATFVEIASATVSPLGEFMDDPAVFDLELENDNNIYIAVEHESGMADADASHYFFGSVRVTDTTIN